ncbi:MAG: uracil-DNA glycosylase [Firmicutes bacterium]|nr:uracil-DNA glycosylase [Bacillota bacterium]
MTDEFDNQDELFDELEKKVKACTLCDLHKTRNRAVPGSGSREAWIMFVGEAPGKNEDSQGLPFVGAAGNFLTELLQSINLDRLDIYITNIVKCRPPNNRDPIPEEMDLCLPWLREQFMLIKPKVICTLGRFAANRLIDPELQISRDHGKFYKKKGQVFCALYHPAAALYNGNLKQVLRDDFLELGRFLEKCRGEMKNT